MPRLIEAPDELAPIGMAELIDMLSADPIDHRDEEAFAARGPLLTRLARNRHFLADIAIAELEARCAGQVRDNLYGPPVIMLHVARDWFVRANIWPAANDSVMTASGPTPFFYGVPHDHNFSFLTVGYAGPGYESDHWELAAPPRSGASGEPVRLIPRGRQRLRQGEVMLYRAHRDVHSQIPPQRLSVTINVVEATVRQPWLDQYGIDPERGIITGLLNPLATATLLPLVAHLGDGDALLTELARRHPSERIRFAAIAARASAASDLAGRVAALETGAASSSRHVRTRARDRLAALARHRDWIERSRSEADGIDAVAAAVAA